MSLERWQASFVAAVRDERHAKSFCDLLGPGSGISTTQGMAVYRGNYRGARSCALASLYPVCRRVLGEACFDALARDWVERTPSTNGDLNLAGEDFPGLLDGLITQRADFSVLPWLADLARLEWRVHRSYYQPDARDLDLGLLRRTADPGRLIPCLAPHIRLLQSDWPVLAIWEAHQDESEPDAMALDKGIFPLVVHRPRFRPEVEQVPPAMFGLLSACQDGWSLGRITRLPDYDERLLPELITRGWLCGFSDTARGD